MNNYTPNLRELENVIKILIRDLCDKNGKQGNLEIEVVEEVVPVEEVAPVEEIIPTREFDSVEEPTDMEVGAVEDPVEGD